MAPAKPVHTSESFTAFTTPEDMTSVRTRATVTKHTARLRRPQRNKPANFQPEKFVQGFLKWRVGSAPSFRHLLESSNGQTKNAQYQQAEAEIGQYSSGLNGNSVRPEESLAQLKDSMQQFLFRSSNSSPLSLDSGRVLADLDSFLTLPIRLTKSGQMLLCNATTLFETSTALGSSPLWIRQGALCHTFQSPMKLYNLLAATSAYLDARFDRGLSTETSYWRLSCIKYQNQLLAHPSTRYGFESVAGIIGSTIMNVVSAEEGVHVHAHALWQLLRYRQSHHMSFASEAEDIYVFLLLISLSKLRSEWLQVEQYATLSVAQDWMSDHNFCLGVFESLLSWTVSMEYCDGRQHCVPSSLRSLLSKCTMLSDDAFIRSQQLWLLSYLTLVSHEYRGDPDGARRFSDILGKYCVEVAQSVAQLPDIIYLLYKNSDTSPLTKWQALRLVEGLHCLSNSTLAKVIYLFTRILQDEVIMQPGGNSVIEDLTQLSNEILRFSPPIYNLLGLLPKEFNNFVGSVGYQSEDAAETPDAMDG